VACEHGIVRHDDAVSNLTIVSDVAVGHDEAVVSNFYKSLPRGVDGCKSRTYSFSR
jgi:hypothetical protein